MKKFRISLIFVVLLLALSLSACTAGAPAVWPGVTATQDTAYVASGNGVFAVNLKDDTMLWRFPEKAAAGKNFFAAPVVSDDGQILVSDYSNSVYSVDSKGQQKWIFDKAKSGFLASVLVTKDGIYAPSTDDNLYALTLQGTLRWSFTAKQPLWAEPVTDGTAIYQSSMDHFLYAINPADGKLTWSVDLGGAIAGSPVLSTDGVLYVGTLAKEVIAVKASNGQIIWRTSTGDGVWAKPVLQDGNLVFGDASGNLYSLNSANGKVNFKKVPNPALGVILGGAAVVPGGFMLNTENGVVINLKPDGTYTKWNDPISGKLYSTPVVVGDQLLIAPMGGTNLLESRKIDGSSNWAFVAPK